MYKQLVLVFFSTLLIAAQAKGQNEQRYYRVATAISAGSHPVEGATVELIRLPDSLILKTELADSDGKVVFEMVKEGRYFLRATMVNYALLMTPAFRCEGVAGDIILPDLVLKTKTGEMQEVIIRANKPYIQRQQDKIVVNVESSISSAGLNSLEVLERAPGVRVDQDDLIGLRGKQGVTVMIDGKASPLKGSELGAFLRGLPSTNIEKIEIIANPSARYDASGAAGIINIVMKKDKRLGYNGTFSAGYGKGLYGKANTGLSLNYRGKKVSAYGSYDYSYRKNYTAFLSNRTFFENQQPSGYFIQHNYQWMPADAHALRFGLDFSLSANQDIGLIYTGNFNANTRLQDNHTNALNDSKALNSMFHTNAFADNDSRNHLVSLNYKRKLDSLGGELSADLDMGRYSNTYLSDFRTAYLKPDGSVLQPPYLISSDQRGRLQFAVAKIDGSKSISKSQRLEAGVKTSWVSNNNQIVFMDRSQAVSRYDSTRSNNFLYTEKNKAAYGNYSAELRKLQIKLGVRLEHTHLEGRQLTAQKAFDSSYLQVFPSAFFTYKLGKNKSIGLSIGRRIERPTFNQLNPFKLFIDPSTFVAGNAQLLPEVTWSYELSLAIKQFNVSATYNSTTSDIVNIILPTDTNGKVLVQMPMNLAAVKSYGLSAYLPFKLAKWWNVTNNIDCYYGFYNGLFGKNSLRRSMPDLTLSSNHSFVLGGARKAELGFSYIAKRLQGFSLVEPRWQLTAGLQQSVLRQKGTLRLNVSDLFLTNIARVESTYQELYEKFSIRRDQRVLTLSFTYRFGKGTVSPARKKSNGAAEEINRAN